MIDLLTDRQKEVAKLLMNGLSNKEIARALNIAHGTVKVHLYDIFQRLEVTSRTKLVHKLITRGQ
jgi:DNA-binding NarL/FixJ family response regulator